MSFRFYQAKEGDLVLDKKRGEKYLLVNMVVRKTSGHDHYRWLGIDLVANKQTVAFSDYNVFGVIHMDLYREGELVECEVPP